jgi:hypothetical protein
VLDGVLAQPLVGAIHVAHDDRNVLEPVVLTARVRRCRPSSRRQVLRQLDRLIPEPHAHDTRAESEDALELLVRFARNLDVRHLLEREDIGKELQGTIHVGDRHAHRVDPTDNRRARAILGRCLGLRPCWNDKSGKRQQQCGDQGPPTLAGTGRGKR